MSYDLPSFSQTDLAKTNNQAVRPRYRDDDDDDDGDDDVGQPSLTSTYRYFQFSHLKFSNSPK